MQLKFESNTYLHLKDEYGKIPNEMIMVIAKTGYGKGLALEGIVGEYHRAGYIVLVLADPKDEIEFGFAQFEPKERYHLRGLKLEGKSPEKKKVKLYHPFSFRIPKGKIPDYNFYSFSLKDLTRQEWSLIAETAWDTDTIKLLVNASDVIGDSDGLYAFLHYIQDMIVGKKEKKSVKPDPKNFYLSVTGGTAKSIQDIANYLRPFKKDYFLHHASSELNIDWKSILSDQEHYHVFVSNYLTDDKLKQFCVATLFNGVIKNKEFMKRPVLVVIPECAVLVPRQPEGYKKFLASIIKDNLSRIRAMGRGMSAILDTQVMTGVDEDVLNRASVTMFGELGGPKDSERVAKARNYRREIRNYLDNMESKNSFLVTKFEDSGPIRMWLPTHMHKEPLYNFKETFKRLCPERLQDYKPLVKKYQELVLQEEERIKKKIRKKQDEETKEKEEKSNEKVKKQDEQISIMKEKAKIAVDKSKNEIMRLVSLEKSRNPDRSWRDIGKEFGIHHITAKKYYEEYNKKTDEEKILEDLEDDGVSKKVQELPEEF